MSVVACRIHPPPLTAASSLFSGSLLGALIGDCHGAPFEFSGRPKCTEVLSHIHRYRGKTDPIRTVEKTERLLRFTDDTAMTRSVAASLVSCRGFDPVDMAKRFSSEYEREPHRGYGYNVTTVFDAINSGKYDDDIYRPARDQFDGSGSYGNGGAMRVAPVALYQFVRCSRATTENISYDKERGEGSSSPPNETPSLAVPTVEALFLDSPEDICVNSTKLTHSNSLGYHGALLQCAAIKLALRAGLSKTSESREFVDEFLDGLIRSMRAAEGGEDRSPKSKKAKPERSEVDDDDDDDDEDESGNDDSDDDEEYYERGDAPGDFPYSAKLGVVRDFLSSRGESSKSRRSRKSFSSDPLLLKPVVKRLGNSVAAHGSVPTAVYCFLRAVMEVAESEREGSRKTRLVKKNVEDDAFDVSFMDDFNGFERAILYAICCGGDTDTIASMTGAIAGAFWGVEAIPESLSASCEGADVARTQASQLAEFPLKR